MRIALVVPGGVDASGRERVVPSLVAFVARVARQDQLLVYVLRYHKEPRSYSLLGARIHDLGSPTGLRRQYKALLRALHRDGPFDVIHGWWGLPAGLLAAVAGVRLRIPSVVTCDSGEFVAIPDIDYGSQLHWRRRLAIALTVRLATAVTVCSGYQAKRAAACCGATCDIVPIGVDTDVFMPGERSEGPPWRLLHVASLNRVKDQATLLAAFERILASGVEAHLDIAGEDTLGGAVQDLARTLNLQRHVTFHGVLPSERLVPLYQRAHLLLVSSRHEAAGVAVLEAAACALPVVGTAVGYLADWSPHRALAVASQDAAGLAAAALDLLNRQSERARIGQSAREWTLARNADWTASQFGRLYRTLARQDR